MFRRMASLGALALSLGFFPSVVAHSPEKVEFNNVDISRAKCCRDFKLTDDAGRVRSLADYRGKVVILTFGFTRCPDICPMTLATMKKALAKLGADAQRVQVLFVTLDPARDTAPVMRKYLDGFDRSFVGLRGNPDVIARTTKEFRVFFKKSPTNSSAGNDYVIDHTLGSYLFDTSGNPQLFVANGKIDLLVSDLKILLRSGGAKARSS